MFYELPPTAAPIRFSDYIKSVFNNKKICVEEITGHLKKFLNVKHISFVSSGRSALTMIIKVLSKLLNDEKGEIIMPAYTCYSVAASIEKAGKSIVLCDINQDRYGYDLNRLKETITQDTLAVVVPHFCGIEANIDGVKKVIGDRKIFIIDDAAQGFGISYHGQKLGARGDVGFYSLGRGKNLTIGRGGIIVTNNEKIAEIINKYFATEDTENFEVINEYKVRHREEVVNSTKRSQYQRLLPSFAKASEDKVLRSFSAVGHPAFGGIRNDKLSKRWFYQIIDHIELLALIFFMNPFCYWFVKRMPFLKIGVTEYSTNFQTKALSMSKVSLLSNIFYKLDVYNNHRVILCKKYLDYFLDVNGIQIPKMDEDDDKGLLRFPILMEDITKRDKVLKELHRLGVGTYYPEPIHKIPQLDNYGFNRAEYQNSEYVAEHLVTLPTHPLVNEKIQLRIMDSIANIVK